jgi:quinol monooxygenase YgiN
MLLIVGTVRLPPEKLADSRPAMERMILASRVERGCVEYGYAADVLDPGLIHVKEMWTDRACLADHFASRHIADWRASWPRLGITDRNLRLYEVDEPQAT